jgi:catechol-2,3-dioxygenase
MITEIRHTGIVVQDLNKVLNFFTKLLRFKIKKKMNENGSYIDNILGLKNVKITTVKIEAPDGSLIELLKFKNFKSKKNWNRKIYSTGLTHISMTVKNLEKTYTLLKKKKIKFNTPPQLSPDKYAKVTFCKGPEGLLIELVEVL